MSKDYKIKDEWVKLRTSVIVWVLDIHYCYVILYVAALSCCPKVRSVQMNLWTLSSSLSPLVPNVLLVFC